MPKRNSVFELSVGVLTHLRIGFSEVMEMMRYFRKALLIAWILTLIIPAAPTVLSRIRPGQRSAFERRILKLDGEDIHIIRDSYGAPHIFAKTDRGGFYGGGYAVAQDRLYQMERFRRDARGEIAEIEGPQAFNRDAVTRSFCYTEAQLQSAFDSLTKEVKESYQAYAEGINCYIKEIIALNKVPEAFIKAGINEPSPWKVTDSIAIAINTAKRFGAIGGGEPLNASILKTLRNKFGKQGDGIFNDLFWVNDPRSPVSVQDKNAPTPATRKLRRVVTALPINKLTGDSLARAYKFAIQKDVVEYGEKRGLPVRWGSYGWVIGPNRTLSGSPILVGGPQMGFSTPQIAHEIHYSTDHLNVVGMAIPGIPVVLVGHNDYLAWTMTSGLTDMIDIFAEKLNPKNKYQYYYKGAYRDMEMRVEKVKIKGGKTLEIELYDTVHGPVSSWDEQAGVAYSYAASYAGHEIKTAEAFYKFNRAKNLEEFGNAAEGIYTNHNLIAASASGDIGYWHCGRPPVRAPGYDQRLPAPGTGEYDWTGLRPFSQMPKIVNPKQGFIVNWNNKPAASYGNGDFPVWGEIYHLHRVEQLIKAHGRMDFDQIRHIIIDISTHDYAADYLKQHLLAAIGRKPRSRSDKRIEEAASYLEMWDNHAEDGSIAKSIFDAWYREMLNATFGETLKEVKALTAAEGSAQVYNLLVQPSLLLHAIEGAKSGVPPSRDYFNGRDRDDVMIASLIEAIDTLTKKQGAQMNLWIYSQGIINFAPLGGIPNTARGTYIQIVELSKPSFRGVNILPPGQSEDPLSPHYGDQREMAAYWRFKSMLYKRDQLEPVSEKPDK
jgi:penicillin amidase